MPRTVCVLPVPAKFVQLSVGQRLETRAEKGGETTRLFYFRLELASACTLLLQGRTGC